MSQGKNRKTIETDSAPDSITDFKCAEDITTDMICQEKEEIDIKSILFPRKQVYTLEPRYREFVGFQSRLQTYHNS